MSYKILEFIILSAIAAFLLNKLFSTIGEVDNNQNLNNRSKKGNLKDISDSAVLLEPEVASQTPSEIKFLEKVTLPNNFDHISSRVSELKEKFEGNFDLSRFVDGAKGAVTMIINSARNGNESMLTMLVDKRYLSKFQESYNNGAIRVEDTNKYNMLISDIYFFVNTAFIKIAFTNKIENSHIIEEWIFTKNLNTPSKEWYLSNIE
ncbi:MAG: hypothetical protein K9G11_04405 [Rickettsiaceae bacterium]|nr:hypothetical protein [Rickettsiaceae bacterium]